MPSALSAAQIAAIDRPGVYRVDRGLYVQVTPTGKSWLCRFQLNGMQRAMGLGPLRLVPLTEARGRAIRAQRQLLDGIDPIETRRSDRRKAAPVVAMPSFAACAADYIEAQRAGWKNEKHQYQWKTTLDTYAGPVIGHLPVNVVSLDHIVEVLTPIWTTKSETATRLRGRIEKVLGWAEAKGLREGPNPAAWRGPLGHMLPAISKVQKIEHHDAVPYVEIPALMAAISARGGTSSAALRFLLLTAARSGEVRGATWSEFDIAERIWTVPASRMKAGREHRVPLDDAALALLPEAGAPDALVFPGAKRGKALSDMSLVAVMRKIRGHGATVHGLRSSFRDWAAEQTDVPREVAEAALAHAVGNEVEAAYKRTTFFDKRRALMTDWATFVVGKS